MNQSRYRPDIDGLRAIAVLSVLAYHLGSLHLSGGFIGVDIFFVISGFLITRLIRDEIAETGKFSFANFYIRRARRLFPALFVTLLVSFVAAAIILAPQHLAEFGGSLVYAITSLANFFFWSQVSYFDIAADLKPLLHTWSLSVEEQFYLFWPLLLLLILRGRGRVWAAFILGAVGLASLGLNLIFAEGNAFSGIPPIARWFSDGKSTIFYLTPFRIFEFVIGAIVLWLPPLPSARQGLVGELVLILGLVLIAVPALTYNDSTLFPSTNALAPCAGAALVIYAGQARYAGLLLRNRVSVGIGLISYSLYLIHWPMIVFYKYVTGGSLRPSAQFVLLAASIISAVLMYRFVEQPFRRQARGAQPLAQAGFALGCSLLALLIIVPSANAWANYGWLWRYPDSVARQLKMTGEDYNRYVGGSLMRLAKPFDDNGMTKVLVVGDSMAGDFVNELVESGLAGMVDLRTLPINHMCQPVLAMDPARYAQVAPSVASMCRDSMAKARANPVLDRASIVILVALWTDWSLDYIAATAKLLREHGVDKIAIVGIKTQPVNGMQFLANNGRDPNFARKRFPVAPMIADFNKKLAATATANDIVFLDPLTLFCGGGCPIALPDGTLIYSDNNHLTQSGARFVGERVRKQWAGDLLGVN